MLTQVPVRTNYPVAQLCCCQFILHAFVMNLLADRNLVLLLSWITDHFASGGCSLMPFSIFSLDVDLMHHLKYSRFSSLSFISSITISKTMFLASRYHKQTILSGLFQHFKQHVYDILIISLSSHTNTILYFYK